MGCRTDRASIFRIGFLTNRLVLWGIAAELTLLAILIYTPFLQPIFNTSPLTSGEWVAVIILALIPATAEELTKLYLRWRDRREMVA